MLRGTLPIYDAIVRAILQRVSRAEVRVGARVVGGIARGLVVLLGVARDDTEADAAFIADRTLGLRVFAEVDLVNEGPVTIILDSRNRG